MHIVGLVEIVVGVAILTRFPKIGAYVAAIWLLAIAANLFLTGHYFDVAVRDVWLAVGAFALGELEQAHGHEKDEARHGRMEHAHA
jgi:hypothetical protein